MVGKCKSCGRLKYNLHDKCLTEIPWLCFSCRDLTENMRKIVQANVARRWMAPSVVPKQKPPIIFSIKRLEVA